MNVTVYGSYKTSVGEYLFVQAEKRDFKQGNEILHEKHAWILFTIYYHHVTTTNRYHNMLHFPLQALILPQVLATPIGGFILDFFEQFDCELGLGYIILFGLTALYFFVSGVFVIKIDIAWAILKLTNWQWQYGVMEKDSL